MSSTWRGILSTTAATTALLTAACAEERTPGPIDFIVSADSLVQMTQDTLEDGTVTSDCSVMLRGRAEGPEGEYIEMRGGRVRYYWWESGTEAATYDFSAEAVENFWVNNMIGTGEERLSRPQGFGQSYPPQLVRAEITFDYQPSNSDSVQTTRPFRFYCF